MARRKYIDRSGDSMEHHMDSGVFLVPNPSINLSGSYAGEDGDLRNPNYNRIPATTKIIPEGTYSKVESTIGVTDDQLQDMFLMHMVTLRQNVIKSKPIECLESVMYAATGEWTITLGKKELTLDCIEELHHIEQLKKHESELSEDELAMLHQVRTQVTTQRPLLEPEYRVFSQLLDVASGLILKWGIFSESNYVYRTKSKALGANTFDLVELSNNLFNIETYWIVTMLKDEPLSQLVPDSVKALAPPLLESTTAAFNYLLAMNSEVDFEKHASIDLYLASQSEEFAQLMNIKFTSKMEKPLYQSLNLPSGLFARCRRRPELAPLRSLRVLLEAMEESYQRFESALFLSFITQP